MTESARARFEILNARGMHARAATKLAELAATFPCQVELAGEQGEAVDGKSVMGVLQLCGAHGTTIEVRATGERAQEAVRAIGALIARRFGESD